MKLPSYFKKMNLSKRILLGYIFMIFFPVLLLSILFYCNVYRSFRQDYASSRQQLLIDSCTQLEINITQIDRIYESLQYNKNLLEYLSNHYSERDAVYTLLKYIRPVLSNLALSNPYIDDIRIYKSDTHPVIMSPEILDLKALENGDSLLCSLGFNGQWTVENDADALRLNYQKVLYTESYSRQIGLLYITTKPTLMYEFLDNIQNIMQSNDVLVLKEEKIICKTSKAFDILSKSDHDMLIHCDNQSRLLYLPVSRIYANEASIPQLGLRLVLLVDEQALSQELFFSSFRFFALIFALLVLVSGFYFYLGTSITARIKRLLLHMQKVGGNNLTPFEEHSFFEDEIYTLAFTFNQMLHRIEELINTANRTELLRREAEYKALQAQIKPHFLYNTIEAIRLLAEEHDDSETANACYSFGRLMRYSLSNKQDIITLEDELHNASFYLQMYKLRMGYKFDYHIKADQDILTVPCPKFIIQPLLENSIIHGISKSNPKGSISLQIERKSPSNIIIITIFDNGIGMSPERLDQLRAVLNNGQKGECYGIANVNERIRAFFDAGSGVHYESEQGKFTCCTIVLHTNADCFECK